MSVLIPAYNARDALELCLLSLARQVLNTEHTVEVIVVDDGSEDGTGTMVTGLSTSLDLRYVFEPRSPTSGRARARNIGLELASGDLVVMLDADQMVAPAFLAEHVCSHTGQDDLLVLGARHQMGEGQADPGRLRGAFSLDAFPPAVRGDERELVLAALACGFEELDTCWHHMWTCNASVRRHHLAAVGGFDEDFLGWGLEDSELGYRLHRSGVRFHYTPRAVVHHEHRGAGVSAQMLGEWRRNLAHFTRKHDDPVVMLQRVFDPVIDPHTASDVTWAECAVRFELAARALHGRSQLPLIPRSQPDTA
ncbi:glycosyltransferase family 2 protein [Streptomyces sioyaensis]|uniref:glycosyltransferase family 2 protein n=1 Tax=Streptomyces sioyaensis TaxID=67364 RepID=UPI0037CDBB4D